MPEWLRMDFDTAPATGKKGPRMYLDGLIWTAVFPVKMGLRAQRMKKGREWSGNSSWRIKDESTNVIRCGCPHVHSVLLRPE